MNFDTCNGVIHVVKRGDTLYKLSRIYKVKLSDIISANPYINGVSPDDLFKFNPDLYKMALAADMEIKYVDFQK